MFVRFVFQQFWLSAWDGTHVVTDNRHSYMYNVHVYILMQLYIYTYTHVYKNCMTSSSCQVIAFCSFSPTTTTRMLSLDSQPFSPPPVIEYLFAPGPGGGGHTET